MNYSAPAEGAERRQRSLSSTSTTSIKYTKQNGDVVDLSDMAIQPTQKTERQVIDETTLIIITSFSTFVCLFTLFTAAMVFYWRKENAIKFSQRKLLNLMLVGVFLVNVTITMQTVPGFYDWNKSCLAVSWGMQIGSSLVFVSLYAKLYRVKELAFAKANKKVKITDEYLLRRIAVFELLLVSYMAFASFVAPSMGFAR